MGFKHLSSHCFRHFGPIYWASVCCILLSAMNAFHCVDKITMPPHCVTCSHWAASRNRILKIFKNMLHSKLIEVSLLNSSTATYYTFKILGAFKRQERDRLARRKPSQEQCPGIVSSLMKQPLSIIVVAHVAVKQQNETQCNSLNLPVWIGTLYKSYWHNITWFICIL